MSKPVTSIFLTGVSRWWHRGALSALIVFLGVAGSLQALDEVNVTANTAGANEQGTVPGFFTVRRSGSTGTLTVNFSVSGSATLNADFTTAQFTGPTGSVAFAQGETSRVISITPIDDADIEGKETTSIALTPNALYIVGASPSAQLDIGDNDMIARIEIEDSRADEDTALSGYVNDLEIQRRGIARVIWTPAGLTRTLAVSFSGTAALGTDYIVQHKIMGAAVAGGPSRIGHEISAPTTGLGYNVYAYLAGEGSVGSGVQIDISAGSATIPSGTTIRFAGDGQDYVVSATNNSSGITPGSIFITPALQRNLANGVAITVSGTSPPSGFSVNNPYPAGSTAVKLADGFGGIFRGDAIRFGTDTSSYVALSDLSGGVLNFVRYSGGGTGAGLNQAITSVTPATTLFTTPITGGVTQFLVAATSDRVEFSITPVGDAAVEGEETVRVTLINDKDYLNSNPTVGTIRIADANVVASIALGSNAGKPNTSGFFEVSFLNGPFPVPITVPYSIDPSSTAVAGTDYTALSGLLTIPAGQTSGIIQVNPLNTAAVGPREVTVSLDATLDYKLAGSGGAVTNSSATVNITDSIGAVSVTAASASAIEHPTLPVTSSFTVSLNRASAGAVSVNYTISGDAVAGTDYQALSGTVTIPDGSNTASIIVIPNDNQVADGSRTVILTLAPGQGYTITTTGTSNAQVRILDDEPTISVTRLQDGTKVTANGVFQIGYPGVPVGTALNRQVEVFFTYSGTGVNGTDYTTSNASSVLIPANTLFATILIAPRETLSDGSDKTVRLTITPNAAYNIGQTANELTIFGADNPSSSKPTPGTINSGSASGGCGLGSGLATLTGLGLFVLLTFRRREH